MKKKKNFICASDTYYILKFMDMIKIFDVMVCYIFIIII